MFTFLPTFNGRTFHLQPQTDSVEWMQEEFGVTCTTGPAFPTVEAARAWATTTYPGSTVLEERPRHYFTPGYAGTPNGYEVWMDSEGYYCRPNAQPTDCELLHGPFETYEEATEHAREEGLR